MKFELQPKKGIIPFEFNESIMGYLKKYPYNFQSREIDEEWDCYSFFSDTIKVYTDDLKKIVSIKCNENLYFNDINLIGCDLGRFLNNINILENQLEKETIWLNEIETQIVYELEILGLQLWVNQYGFIKTIFANDGK